MTGVRVEDLRFAYRDRPVLRGVTFAHGAGVLGVLGANGAGKTTLFKCMLGLLRAYQGAVTVDGRDVRDLSPRQMARCAAYVPQSHATAFGYAVEDMVLMGAAAGCLAPSRDQRRAALAALERVGIADLAGRDYARLSGGERQLTLIARALAQSARVLVLDEPTANLDYGNQQRVLQTISRLAAQGLSVVMSTHHPDQALQCADRVLALDGGRAAAFGPPGEVICPAMLRRLYGVEARVEATSGGARVCVCQNGRNLNSNLGGDS